MSGTVPATASAVARRAGAHCNYGAALRDGRRPAQCGRPYAAEYYGVCAVLRCLQFQFTQNWASPLATGHHFRRSSRRWARPENRCHAPPPRPTSARRAETLHPTTCRLPAPFVSLRRLCTAHCAQQRSAHPPNSPAQARASLRRRKYQAALSLPRPQILPFHLASQQRPRPCSQVAAVVDTAKIGRIPQQLAVPFLRRSARPASLAGRPPQPAPSSGQPRGQSDPDPVRSWSGRRGHKGALPGHTRSPSIHVRPPPLDHSSTHPLTPSSIPQ